MLQSISICIYPPDHHLTLHFACVCVCVSTCVGVLKLLVRQRPSNSSSLTVRETSSLMIVVWFWQTHMRMHTHQTHTFKSAGPSCFPPLHTTTLRPHTPFMFLNIDKQLCNINILDGLQEHLNKISPHHPPPCVSSSLSFVFHLCNVFVCLGSRGETRGLK